MEIIFNLKAPAISNVVKEVSKCNIDERCFPKRVVGFCCFILLETMFVFLWWAELIESSEAEIRVMVEWKLEWNIYIIMSHLLLKMYLREKATCGKVETRTHAAKIPEFTFLRCFTYRTISHTQIKNKIPNYSNVSSSTALQWHSNTGSKSSQTLVLLDASLLPPSLLSVCLSVHPPGLFSQFSSHKLLYQIIYSRLSVLSLLSLTDKSMSTANLFVTVRWKCPVKMHPTVARFVFPLIASPVSHSLLSSVTSSHLHTCKYNRHDRLHTETQTNKRTVWLSGFTTTALAFWQTAFAYWACHWAM